MGIVGLFAKPHHVDPTRWALPRPVAEMATNEIPREAGAADRAAAEERQRETAAGPWPARRRLQLKLRCCVGRLGHQGLNALLWKFLCTRRLGRCGEDLRRAGEGRLANSGGRTAGLELRDQHLIHDQLARALLLRVVHAVTEHDLSLAVFGRHEDQ